MDINATVISMNVIKYTLQKKITTSYLFTENKFNQYWWQLPTEI